MFVPRCLGLAAFVATWMLSLSTLVVREAHAEESTPGESERALPGLVRVGVPTPSTAPVVGSVSAGYGFLDDTGASDGGHRLHGTLGAAFAPLPYLALGADVRGRWDRYADESNLYGEPRLTLRYSRPASARAFWGLELDARLVGAEAPSIEPSATSPSLRGLLGLKLSERTWFAAQLGFQLDRSGEAVPDATLLSAADRRTLGASSFNSVGWGLGLSHRLSGAKTELLGEISGDWLLGADAPGFTRSPYRVTFGARQPLSRAFSLLATAELGLSSREVQPAARLVPVEPRVGGGLALLWRFERDEPPPRPAPKPEPRVEKKEPPNPPEVEPVLPVIPTTPVSGTVVDEGGRPLADVEVTLLRENDEPLVGRTFADGSFEFKEVPEGVVKLRAVTPGFDTAEMEIAEGAERRREIVLRPSVPAGQVRGKVLDLQGNAIAATITVNPGGHSVEVQPDGSFELELAPGQYTVKFEHNDFSNQFRKIRVRNRGVVILNIALTR